MTKANQSKPRLSTHRPSAIEYDAQRSNVLKGHNFQALIDPPNLVRIFVCSTFYDFVNERNFLYNNAFRTLETWCREKGLEFQVVDLRWGVRQGEAFDGAVTQCLREVENCQKVSVGPNFVAFIGDRYGFRPLPPIIPQDEWKIIMDNIGDKNQQKNVASVYQLDENSIQPEYLLNSEQENNQHLREIVEQAAQIAVDKGQLSEDKGHKYYASMTEQEIWRGLLNVEEPERSALCFLRTFTNFENLKPEMINKQIGRYMDLGSNNQRNEKAAKLLKNLKKIQIPAKLDSANIVNFSLTADLEQGVNPVDPEHRDYMEKLNKILVEKLQDMITEGIKRQVKSTVQDVIYREVAQHAQFCLTKCQLFTGRKSFITTMIQALQNNEAKQPIVVKGESGVGKTAFMAKLILEISSQLKPKICVIYRFLGITAQSSTIDQLLLSVAQQIAQVYGLPEPTVQERDFNTLRPYFANLLKTLAEQGKTKSKPLAIIFDSMDQLSAVYGAYSMNWLPIELPEGVNIILSVQPVTNNILPRLESRIQPCNIHTIQPMSNKSAGEVIKLLVEQAGRKLQENQMAAIERVVTKNSSPLLIHLIALEALKWYSFTKIENNRLPSTIRDAVQYLFDRLERSHGKLLVGRALGYLVLSRNGLSEKELQEILSLDDDVLQDLYQYWEPPNKTQIQLPPMQWARFKYDMTDFISQRTSDDMTVITLYHQQFIEVILARYVNSAGERKRMFKTLADFFAGTWAKEPKALKLIITNKELLYNPLRRVRPQPLQFGGRYNLRKLNNLPFYLNKCNNYETLSHQVFGNYEWLEVKRKACGMKSILDDFALIDRNEMDNPMNCLKQTVRLAKVTLEFPDNQDILATEILGRLRMSGSQQPLIQRLLEQCENYCIHSADTLLVPLNQCYLAPNGLLLTTLAGHRSGVIQVVSTPDQNLLITSSLDKTIRVWDLETDTVMHIIDVNLPCHITINETGLVFYVANKDCILIYDVKMGILSNRIDPPTEFRKKSKETLTLPGTPDEKSTLSLQCHVTSRYLITSYGKCIDFYETSAFSHAKRYELNFDCTFMKIENDVAVIGCGTNCAVVVDCSGESLKVKPCQHQECEKLLTCFVAINEKGKSIVGVGEKDKKTCVYSNGKLVITYLLDSPPAAACFSETYLAVGADSVVNIVKIGTWKSCMTLPLNSTVTQLQFLDNQDLSILVSTLDATVHLYNLRGEMKRYLTGFWSSPTSLNVKGTLLMTSSQEDPYVKMWELGSTCWGPDTPMLITSLSPLPAVYCRPDGTFVICSKSVDGKIINVADGTGIKFNFDLEISLLGMEMISDKEMITITDDGVISVINVTPKAAGKVSRKMLNDKDRVMSYHVSMKHQIVGFLTTQNEAVLVDLKSQKEIRCSVDNEFHKILVCPFAPYHFLLFGDKSSPVLMNNQGKQLYDLDVPDNSEKENIFSKKIILATANGKLAAFYSVITDKVYLHNLEKRKFQCGTEKTQGAVSCLNITDDNNFLLVGTSTSENMALARRQIFLYHTVDGSLIRKFFIYAPAENLHSFGQIIGVTTGLGYFGSFRLHVPSVTDKDHVTNGQAYESDNDDKTSRKSEKSSMNLKPQTSISSINSKSAPPKKSKTCNIL